MTIYSKKQSIPEEMPDISTYKGKALVRGLDYPEGIHANMRGEGAWTAKVATLLRLYGYDVTSMPTSWGPREISAEYADKQMGIKFIHDINDLEEYDLFFEHEMFFASHPARWAEIKNVVDRSLFGTWWPTPELIDTQFKLPKNSQAVTAFFSTEDRIKTLPRVFVDNMGKPKFENKTIVWTNRSPFGTYKGPSYYLVNLYHLRATLEAVEKGYKAIILCSGPGGHSFYYDDPSGYPDNSEMLKEVKNIVTKLKTFGSRVEFLEYMPCDKFTENLRRGSVSIVCDAVGALPTCVSNGVAPVIFYNWNSRFISSMLLENYGTVGSYELTSESEVKDRIFNLLTDKEYYTKYLSDFQENTSVYTTEESLKLLHAIIKG